MSAFGPKQTFHLALQMSAFDPKPTSAVCYGTCLVPGAGVDMRRREFFTVLGGAAAWPLVAHAQPAMPVMGFLHYSSPKKLGHLAAAVRQGLKESGYIEGQNVTILYRWAEGHYD
jgi:hypothetical protein